MAKRKSILTLDGKGRPRLVRTPHLARPSRRAFVEILSEKPKSKSILTLDGKGRPRLVRTPHLARSSTRPFMKMLRDLRATRIFSEEISFNLYAKKGQRGKTEIVIFDRIGEHQYSESGVFQPRGDSLPKGQYTRDLRYEGYVLPSQPHIIRANAYALIPSAPKDAPVYTRPIRLTPSEMKVWLFRKKQGLGADEAEQVAHVFSVMSSNDLAPNEKQAEIKQAAIAAMKQNMPVLGNYIIRLTQTYPELRA